MGGRSRDPNGGESLHSLTDFADAAITLPLLFLVGLFLAIRRHRQAQVGWIVAIGGAFAAILTLKLMFGIFPALGTGIDVRSPSGHTATATAAYGGLALLLFGRWAGFCAAIATAVAIGLSRLALRVHSIPEVLIGGAVGIGAVLALALLSRVTLPRRDATLLVVLAASLVAIGHGRYLVIEPTLVHLERSLRP